jgi:hypothetical protein
MTFDLGTWNKVVDWLAPSHPNFKILLSHCQLKSYEQFTKTLFKKKPNLEPL